MSTSQGSPDDLYERLRVAATIAAMAKKAAVLISPDWIGLRLCELTFGSPEAVRQGHLLAFVESVQAVSPGLVIQQMKEDVTEGNIRVLVPWQHVLGVMWDDALDPKKGFGFPTQNNAIQSDQ